MFNTSSGGSLNLKAGPSVEHCDVLVIGSGAGGLSAATACQVRGLRTIVVEKAEVFGGTSARSGGVLWIPGNPVNRAAGAEEPPGDARKYLRSEAGDRFDPERVDTYLAVGPQMVDFFEKETAVRFRPMVSFPDYHPDAPGGAGGGRSIQAAPLLRGAFRAALRRWPQLAHLAKPLPAATVLGLHVSREELPQFYAAFRSPSAFLRVAATLAAHMGDLLLHGRGLRAVNGGALVARLGISFAGAGGQLRLGCPALRLLTAAGTVTGAVIRQDGREHMVIARRGVVLAAGGFPHDMARRRTLYPHHPDADGHVSIAAPSSTGDGLRLAEEVGAATTIDWPSPAAWTPASRATNRKGVVRVFPHFVDRGKPGIIMVDAAGRRFVNESSPYSDIGRVMTTLQSAGKSVHGFILADHRALRRYGLGMVRPAPIPIGAHLKSGYLLKADTVAALAGLMSMDAGVLADTLGHFNAQAAQGRDTDFGKGSNRYDRYQGDSKHAPNPCLAPLCTPPYYAVRINPGDIGTFAGLRTNARAQVMKTDGAIIGGLYAVGNDQASVFGGGYPGGGATLGPAMTFGYIAALELCAAPPRDDEDAITSRGTPLLQPVA